MCWVEEVTLVEDTLQLKNYLVEVSRLLKHLMLYYSLVSNCLTELMALEGKREILGLSIEEDRARGEFTFVGYSLSWLNLGIL
jgi:hypothetical protein